LERSVFNRNPGSWFFKKTGLNRHRGVLSEKWAKKGLQKFWCSPTLLIYTTPESNKM
jgi:hypothetical protein